MKKYLILLYTGICLAACEKEINIKLPPEQSKFVIEGWLNSDSNSVKITRSVPLSVSNENYPTISDARVSITDKTLEKSYKLQAIQVKSIYNTNSLKGMNGHTYILQVQIGNEHFNAQSTIPDKTIDIDSITYRLSFTLGRDQNKNNEKPIRLTVYYHAPVTPANYFQFIIRRNNKTEKGIFTRHDENFTKEVKNFNFNLSVTANDIIEVEMQNIDKKVYEYFTDVTNNIKQNSAAPTNPVSNFGNNVLGYFKAYSISKKSIVITNL